MANKRMNKKKTSKRRNSKRNALVREFRLAQRAANKKVKEVNKSGLRNIIPQWSKKWNVYLNNPKYATKTGYWRGDATKMNMKQLSHMTKILIDFNSNRYNTVEWGQSYAKEQMETLGISDPNLLSRIYQVWREYGYATEYNSDREALTEIALFVNNTPRWMDIGNWLLQAKDNWEEKMQTAATTDDLKTMLKNFNNNSKEYPLGL